MVNKLNNYFSVHQVSDIFCSFREDLSKELPGQCHSVMPAVIISYAQDRWAASYEKYKNEPDVAFRVTFIPRSSTSDLSPT